jgi:hypothetical protein
MEGLGMLEAGFDPRTGAGVDTGHLAERGEEVAVAADIASEVVAAAAASDSALEALVHPATQVLEEVIVSSEDHYRKVLPLATSEADHLDSVTGGYMVSGAS